jgi:hypothetical protein
VHSHEACVRAIDQHDIVVAFLDAAEGGTFQIGSATPEFVADLRNLDVLPPAGSPLPLPTITQVEVLTARSLGKPVIVFMTEDVNTRVDEDLALLRKGGLKLKRRSSSSPPLTDLLRSGSLVEILEHYEVPVGRIASARHLFFLDRIRKEAPNYITFYDKRRLGDLAGMLRSRLAGLIPVLIRQHAGDAQRRVQRDRGVLTLQSLRDLLESNLILEPPYELVSGSLPGTAPLYDVRGETPQELASAVQQGNNVLLLGDPGHGKSTAALLSFRELAKASRAGVKAQAPLFVKLRDLAFPDDAEVSWSAETFLRTVLALPSGRSRWPERLPLPQLQWCLFLDGADESRLSGSRLKSLIEGLPPGSRILLTCRSTVFDRLYSSSRKHFDAILRLRRWDKTQVQRYADALRVAGKDRAAALVEQNIDEATLADFVSIPLWLSMLAYLAERDSGSVRIRQAINTRRGYNLLRICATEVAQDEAERQGLDQGVSPDLQRIWRDVAWRLRKSRGDGRPLKWSTVRQSLGIQASSQFESAVLAVLDAPYGGEEVHGFFHEVFFEYWLAEYIVEQLSDTAVSPAQLAELFALHRSHVTNKLIRERIQAQEEASRIAARLREAYYEAGGLGHARHSARNQILYLIARIDTGEATRELLRTSWRTESDEFVKYAAAFSAALLGLEDVESEYALHLRDNPSADRLNRGYHLSYYGDTDPLNETAEVPEDTGASDALQTIIQLFKRLSRSEERHRHLRRIELFTIRRFLETGRAIPMDVQDPVGVIRDVERELQALSPSEFRDSALQEATRVLQLLGV